MLLAKVSIYIYWTVILMDEFLFPGSVSDVEHVHVVSRRGSLTSETHVR